MVFTVETDTNRILIAVSRNVRSLVILNFKNRISNNSKYSENFFSVYMLAAESMVTCIKIIYFGPKVLLESYRSKLYLCLTEIMLLT